MALRPARPCAYPGCPRPAQRGSRYCDLHAQFEKAVAREYERRRGSPSKRGYDSQWQRVRAIKLAEQPLCEDCLAEGVITLATEVHHVDKGAAAQGMHDVARLLSLCKKHHSMRTLRGE